MSLRSAFVERAGSRPRAPGAAPALHPGAWLAWLAAVCAAALLVSNLLYLSLGLLVAAVVFAAVHDTRKGRALLPFVALGLGLAALSVPFNVLTGSVGETTVVTLPELALPDWFGGVTFGGAVTGEALVAATGRALTIGTLVLAAAAFNAAVDHFRLLRLAPRPLAPIMLAFSVAAVVLPQSVAQARTVAEAQRLRGRPARGARALPGLLLPTLRGALERSVQRAESLDARGFGAGPSGGPLHAVLGAGGLGLLAWGAFAHFYYGPDLTWTASMLTGAGAVVASLARGGGRRTARLRADPWTPLDGVTAASAGLSVVVLLVMRVAGVGEAAYVPYPEVGAPAFHPGGAAAFLLFVTPALPALLGLRSTEAAT